MAKPATTHVLEIEAGIGEPAFIPLTLGQELQPISVGKKGMWRIESPRVLDVHAFVYFDGNSLFLQSADDQAAATVDGFRVGKAWTELHAPCKIEIGQARLRFRSLLPNADGNATAAAPRPPVQAPPPAASRPAPAQSAPAPVPSRPAHDRPFRPGEFISADDESTRIAPLEATSATRGGGPRPAAGRPAEGPSVPPGAPGASGAFAPAQTGMMPGMMPPQGMAGPGMAPGMAPPGMAPTSMPPGMMPQPGMAPPGYPQPAPSGPYPPAGPSGAYPPAGPSGPYLPAGASGAYPQAGASGAYPPAGYPPGAPYGAMPPGGVPTMAAPGANPSMPPGGFGSMTQPGQQPQPQGEGLLAKWKALPSKTRMMIMLVPFYMVAAYFLLFEEEEPAPRKPVAALDAGVVDEGGVPAAGVVAAGGVVVGDGGASAIADAGVVATPGTVPPPPGWPAGVPFPPPGWPPGMPYPWPPGSQTPVPAAGTAPVVAAAADAGATAPPVEAPPPTPKGQKSLERQAVDAYSQGEYEKAAQIYETLSAQNPNNRVYAEAARILRAKLDAGAP